MLLSKFFCIRNFLICDFDMEKIFISAIVNILKIGVSFALLTIGVLWVKRYLLFMTIIQETIVLYYNVEFKYTHFYKMNIRN